MKAQLQRAAFTVLMVLSTVLCIGGVTIQPAAALPVTYFAATGGCDLPDGNPGVYDKSGKTCCPSNTIGNDGNADPIRCLYAKYVNPIINLLAAVVGIAVIAAIIYGAIEYTTSAGDPQRIASGKKRIIEALIGLAAFLLLYAFLAFLVPGGQFSQ